MRDLLLIGIVGLCALIALRRPVFGMLTFVSLGFLNPHAMTWGIAQTFPFSQLAGGSTIIGYLLWLERKSFPRRWESLILLGLWCMFGISTIFAIHPDKAFEYFVHISKILTMVFLSTALINTERRLHWLLRIIALSLGYHGLKSGIFVVITGGNYMVWGPEGTFLTANNAIGLALVMNIPILLYLLQIENYRWLRWLMKAMLAFSFLAIICTFSRGAWIGLAIVIGMVLLKSRHKLLIAGTVAIIGISILPYLTQHLPQRVILRYEDLLNYEQEASAQSRFWNWELCKRVGLAHPLTGGGFDFYSTELYAIYFPEFTERYGPQKVWSCHSIWFTILAEHGLLGFTLWVVLIISYFLSLRRMRLYARTYAEMSWAAPCADMLQIALVAFLVVGTFLDAAYFDMFYYLVAILIIINERIALAAAQLISPATVTSTDRVLYPHYQNHTTLANGVNPDLSSAAPPGSTGEGRGAYVAL